MMNLVPKRSLWVIKCVRLLRMFSANRPNKAASSGGITYHPTIESAKKQAAKEDVIESMACVAPQTQTPLPVSEGNPGMPNTGKTEASEKEAGEFLTRFYGDQIRYFRKIAKVNKVAMKRIQKLKKDWLKFVENHF